MTNIKFLEPVFLPLLIPLAALFVLWVIAALIKISSRPDKTYGSKYPLIGRIKLWGLFVLPAGALMVMALAKPYLPQNSFSIARGNVEVILVIDRSISMRAADISGSRLEAAKREATAIESMLHDGDKAALFVFGRESHPKIRLTEKRETVLKRVSQISFPKNIKGDALVWDSDFAGMLMNIYFSMDRQDAYNEGYSGPRFAGGFGEARKRYVPKYRTNRIVILMSDGEDQLRIDGIRGVEKYKKEYIPRLNRALAEFKRRGLKIYPLGIGTAKGSNWLSLLDGYKPEEDYPKTLVESWKGQVTRLDKENLSFLARMTGVQLSGHSWTIETGSASAGSYLSSIINSNRKELINFEDSGDNEQQLWQYFLLASVAMLILGIISYPLSGYFRRNKN